ncbi:MAG: hypothetical protein ACMUJM_04425 [bacterium]
MRRVFPLLVILLVIVPGRQVWAITQKKPIRLFRVGQEHGRFELDNTDYTIRGISMSLLIPVTRQERNQIFLSCLYSYGKSHPARLDYSTLSLQYVAIMLSDYFIKPNFKVGMSQFKLSRRKENYGMTLGAGFSIGSELAGFFFDPIQISLHEIDGQFPLVYTARVGICTKF